MQQLACCNQGLQRSTETAPPPRHGLSASAMEHCWLPELPRLLRPSTPSSCPYSSTTTTSSHTGHSSDDFCNRSYVSETCLMFAMSDHSLSNVGRSCGAATRAMFLKQDPYCRKKNLHNRNNSFLSETKDMLQKSFETRPQLQKKNLHHQIVFSFFLKLVLCCRNLLKQDPCCGKKTECT